METVIKLHEQLKRESTQEAKANDKVKKILHALSKSHVTTQILRETMVGKTVQTWKHHPALGAKAKDLLKSWKGVVKQELASTGTPITTTTSATTVCNVKVQYIRPKYDNLRSWMEDTERNEYIGRKGVVFVDGQRFPPCDSIWANPFKISKNLSREGAIQQYEVHLRERLKKDPSLKGELLKLGGKRLGCWCHPEGCHGHVLARAIAQIRTGEGDW
jgi:Domain of unknown function (DUF4326)/TFIIS helical bundle-like domain